MQKLMQTLTLGAAAAAMLAACSSAPSNEEEMADWMNDARLGEKVDRICFQSSIDNFRMATKNTVIVEKGVNKEYLIEVMGSCHDLAHANALSFDTFPGSGCISKGDSIYGYDSVFGRDNTGIPPMRCPISSIYEWNEDAVEDTEDE
ncbi:DUF6491 family protein [Henriciella sp.]|uniref:DUF6491 family protein n=1 Tax=Henriciella sp. TaxID=1968823 RepID=UPI002628B644|nr:DUF6491 family protein [Henriciella sp.]